jgi:hypothetical protein
MKRMFRNKGIPIILSIIGAIGGFLYWKFVGCNNGSCIIKSVWYWSTLWGATVGFLFGDIINGFVKTKKRGEKR